MQSIKRPLFKRYLILRISGLLLLGGLWAGSAFASPVEVVQVAFVKSGGSWNVSVTLRHADTGWNHYADLWVVESLQGKELGRRVLVHPHENEQPFTRQTMVTLPAGTKKVRVRAGDNVNGINSKIVVVDLFKSKGELYTVTR